MFENWLRPIDRKEIVLRRPAPYQFGRQVKIFGKEWPDLRDVRIGLIGIGDKEANAVRSALYEMSFPFEGLQIADLGNARKADPAFLIPMIRELLESGIFPVLIGADAQGTPAQYKAFLSLQQHTSLAVVDERVRYNPGAEAQAEDYLNDILGNRRSQLFHLALLGIQAHYVDPAVLELLDKKNFEYVGLGRARTNLSELEPIIRDADLLSFHISAIKQLEAPGQAFPTPSGFFTEEACQICRYAGMSDKLKSFGIYGYRKTPDRKGVGAHTVAQMVWYFIDGFFNRKNDFPASTDGLVEYIVEFKEREFQIVFWKSSKSGRWWMQVPVKTNKKIQRHRLVPCSYNDYKLAGQEELPDRLLNALKRFS